MTDGWLSMDEAQKVRYGTVADLRMPNGRVYRALLAGKRPSAEGPPFSPAPYLLRETR